MLDLATNGKVARGAAMAVVVDALSMAQDFRNNGIRFLSAHTIRLFQISWQNCRAEVRVGASRLADQAVVATVFACSAPVGYGTGRPFRSIEQQLADRCLDSIALSRRSGGAVAGYEKTWPGCRGLCLRLVASVRRF